jgi:hypothetical protein
VNNETRLALSSAYRRHIDQGHNTNDPEAFFAECVDEACMQYATAARAEFLHMPASRDHERPADPIPGIIGRLDAADTALGRHLEMLDERELVDGQHDKRLTKLAGRVDNANRVITETRGELTGLRDELAAVRRDVADADEHSREHCANFVTVTEHANRLADGVNRLTDGLTAVERRLAFPAEIDAVRATESTIARTQFANVAELAETVYARVRAADVWMARATDADEADYAAHHRQIAAVLATMHATLCIDDRRREDEMRAGADSLDEWAHEIKAFSAHRRHPGGYRFEQCPLAPCVHLGGDRRAAYLVARGGPTPTMSDAELATVFADHRQHARRTHRAFAECMLAPCVVISQLEREAYAQRVERRPGGVYGNSSPAEAFGTKAYDAIREMGEVPSAAAVKEAARAFVQHGTKHSGGLFAQCFDIPCGGISRAMRYLYANSSDGLRYAIMTHALNDHGVDFWTCDRQPCRSCETAGREHYAGTTVIDRDEQGGAVFVTEEAPLTEPLGIAFYGSPGQVVHIAADGSTVHQGPAADCSASGCMRARGGSDDSMADMAAASAANDIEAAWNTHGASINGESTGQRHMNIFEACKLDPCAGLSVVDRETFASERGKPNDPHREG